MKQYLKYFPKPLLNDLIAGRWLPVIGAGMSRNAVVPAQHQVPLWDELGRELAQELQDYPYVGALDAISAYSHEYGRPRMVERVAEALLINEALPGDAHRAFCSILFDIVCTTNVDLLLERQYETKHRYCRLIIDEDNLAVNDRSNSPTLLKLHGDVRHPARLVLTEEDYDLFLEKYPLIATYLANLLITRTAVLIGYSLDDPDFRQIWQVVSERLGKIRRLAYALLVDAKGTDIARFARRGVKVINLPGSRAKYSQILTATFNELHEYMQTHLIKASHVTEEEPLTEFFLPQEAPTRLCFFAVSLVLQPQYRDQVFPLAERAGLVPVTAADVIAPGDIYTAKIDAIMRRSTAAVVDITSQNTILELGMIMALREPVKTLIVVGEGTAVPSNIADHAYIVRSKIPIADQPNLLNQFNEWFQSVAATIQPRLAEEPLRLLSIREYRAAVISAITYLEWLLRKALNLDKDERLPGRVHQLGFLIDLAAGGELITSTDQTQLRKWMRIRNTIVHSQETVDRPTANEIVKGILDIGRKLARNS